MSQFLSLLSVQRIDNTIWRLLEVLVYESDILMQTVTVPIDFRTDFASVPRWIPLAYATTGNTAQPAAVVHDFLYQTHGASREDSDGVFHEAMLVLGEPHWRATAMYRAVRAFGWIAYQNGLDRCITLNARAASPAHWLAVAAARTIEEEENA